MDVSSSLSEFWHYLHRQNQEKITDVVEYWRFHQTIWDIFGIHKHYERFKLTKNTYYLPTHNMGEPKLNLLQTGGITLLRNAKEKRWSKTRILENILNLQNDVIMWPIMFH
jgi:hypothetical protein